MARTTATLHCAYMYMHNGGGLILRVRRTYNGEYRICIAPAPSPLEEQYQILKSYQAKVL